jgi:uncharacterized membrane protein
MRTVSSALGGFVLGATVARLLDPRSGARRRAQVLQKGMHTTHEAADFTGKSLRDLRNRSRGILHALFGSTGPVDDAVLVERVRSKLGRFSSHPGAIEVSVSDGCVELRGPVLAAEHQQVIDAVADVRGVRRVDDDLQVHKQPDVPALQGGAGRRIPRPELLQENWAPGTRLIVGSAGATLIAWGVARRSILGVSAGGIGALLLARSIANLPVKRVVGVGAGRRGVDVRKSIFIAASPDEVYRFFVAAENFPRFMEHVREVRITPDGRWHWRVDGPAGSDIEWVAEVTRAEPGELLSWRTVPNSVVENSGTVRFISENGGTRVDVRLSYVPPLGAIGHAIAALFGSHPKKQLDDDLVRLKSLLEQGKATGHERQVSRDQLS